MILDLIFRDAGVVELCYILHVFDMKYQQKFTASQPIKVEYKFYGDVLNDINGYALVLTNKLACISSDGQRRFYMV